MTQPPPSAKGAARREEILQTAARTLAANGYRNTSMRAIGRELDIEPAHILYYFDSREDLLQRVVERWDAEAMESLGHEITPTTALDDYVTVIARNLQVPGLVHLYLATAAEAIDRDHAANPYFRDRFAVVRQLLEDAIRYEQQHGTISADAEPAGEARKLLALADGLQLQSLVCGDFDVATDLMAAVSALRSTSTTR